MNRITRTGLVASLALAALTGCQKGSDADKGGDDPALNAPTSSATSTATAPASDDVDTLWGKMKDATPFLADIRANQPSYFDDPNITDETSQDNALRTFAYIQCEGLRQGKTVKQLTDELLADGTGSATHAQITYIISAAARIVCPDQKAKATS